MRFELSKALRSKEFKISCLIGVVLVVGHIIYISNYLRGMYQEDDSLLADATFLQAWIGQDPFSGFGEILYSVIFPSLAALPYAASHFRDKKLGYDKQVIVRMGKRRYFSLKVFAAFITGGISVTIPPLISLMFAMSWLPIAPTYADMQGEMAMGRLWSYIYFVNPMRYVIRYLALDFVVGGVLSVLSLSLTFIINNAFSIIVLPMMMNLLIFDIANTSEGLINDLLFYIPYTYINPMGGTFSSFSQIIISIVVILISSCALYFLSGIRKDVLS